MRRPPIADALSLLSISSEDLGYILNTYELLRLLQPPVENGWMVPIDSSLLQGAVLILHSPLRVRSIVATGTSEGTWWVRLDDGDTAQPKDIIKQEAGDLDDSTLDALEEELRAALQQGRRSPIRLPQSVSAVERIVQLNHCGEPVRRLWALRQEAERMDGGGGGSGGSAPQPGSPSFLALWQESVGLSAQVAFTLRERLSEEERRRVEGVLRGFCEQEERVQATVVADSGLFVPTPVAMEPFGPPLRSVPSDRLLSADMRCASPTPRPERPAAAAPEACASPEPMVPQLPAATACVEGSPERIGAASTTPPHAYGAAAGPVQGLQTALTLAPEVACARPVDSCGVAPKSPGPQDADAELQPPSCVTESHLGTSRWASHQAPGEAAASGALEGSDAVQPATPVPAAALAPAAAPNPFGEEATVPSCAVPAQCALTAGCLPRHDSSYRAVSEPLSGGSGSEGERGRGGHSVVDGKDGPSLPCPHADAGQPAASPRTARAPLSLCKAGRQSSVKRSRSRSRSQPRLPCGDQERDRHRSRGKAPDQDAGRQQSRNRSRSSSRSRSGAGWEHRGGRSRSRSRERGGSRGGVSRQPPRPDPRWQPSPPQPPRGRDPADSGCLTSSEIVELQGLLLAHIRASERAGREADLSLAGVPLTLRHRLMDVRLKMSQFVRRYMYPHVELIADGSRALLVPRRR